MSFSNPFFFFAILCIFLCIFLPGRKKRITTCHISAVSDLSQEKVELLELYLKAVKLFRNYEDPSEDPVYSEVGTSSDFES